MNPSDRPSPVDEARRLLAREAHGMLSTLSQRVPGWPFGSLVPYAVASDGAIVMVLSDLAEHTRNLVADDRASLLVGAREAADDPQSGGRVTVLGRARRLSGAEAAEARARCDARLPPGRTPLATPDFGTWRLSIDHVRYIGGFGVIRWLEAREVQEGLATATESAR